MWAMCVLQVLGNLSGDAGAVLLVVTRIAWMVAVPAAVECGVPAMTAAIAERTVAMLIAVDLAMSMVVQMPVAFEMVGRVLLVVMRAVWMVVRPAVVECMVPAMTAAIAERAVVMLIDMDLARSMVVQVTVADGEMLAVNDGTTVGLWSFFFAPGDCLFTSCCRRAA